MKIQNFFKKGFYINLESRNDRRLIFENQAKLYNLDSFFKRFDAIHYSDERYNFTNKHHACFATYQHLIEKCYKEEYENVLIFEDDAFLLENSLDNIEKALDDLKDIPNWDLVYLGCMILDKYLNKISDNLLKQNTLLTTHAIGYNRSGIEKLYKAICNIPANGVIDSYLGQRNHFEKYVVYPLSVVQHNLTLSDLSGANEIHIPPSSNGAPLFDYTRGFESKFYTEDKHNMQLLDKNFVTCKLQGRTGNMMFQIAHAYAKALQYDRQFVVPKMESSSGHLEESLFRKIDFFIDKTDNIPIPRLDCTAPFHYENISIPDGHAPTIYAGWYQSEKYFLNYKNNVRSLFSPTKAFVEKAYKEYPFLQNERVAAINVRRGDYLEQASRHPVISLGYILEAYKSLPSHDKLLVVSDDIEWCKANINLPNVVFNDNLKFWDLDALWLLSLCDHFIISNSSFSWWGAWLSKNPFKTVIAPSLWVGPDITEDTQDIWCDGWIKIPTFYNEGVLEVAL